MKKGANVRVLSIIFRSFQTREWITPSKPSGTSNSEEIVLRTRKDPPPECGWSELPRVCSCLAISYINKLRGGREETTTPPKNLVRKKPCLQAEEPVNLKSWSETKPNTVRSRWILPTKLLPPDPLLMWRPTTPSPNLSSILTTFTEKMMILNPC